jgi:hypothetical protein
MAYSVDITVGHCLPEADVKEMSPFMGWQCRGEKEQEAF